MKQFGLGFCARSVEHFVVLKDGGPALRVRTVRPVSTSLRGDKDAVFAVKATQNVLIREVLTRQIP